MARAPGGSSTQSFSVLVVDDEKNIRSTLSVCLESIGCRVLAVGTGQAAREAVAGRAFDLALVDLRLAQEDGLDLIPALLAAQTSLQVVIITAHASFDTAVEAVKRGAVDYLPKPFTPAQIRQVVEQAVSRRFVERRKDELEERLAEEVPETDLGTESPRLRAVLGTLERAAASDAPVLLRGESGTGKGILARALHARSPRRERPFVTVSCPTLTEELLGSELFGHARGAFTGAVQDRAGKVEAALGGTLFLDEIGEITTALQAKLLRFLQEKQFERVGENVTRRADVRVVAATNRDLDRDVREGRFREDLLYRVNVIEVQVPPLRERPEDVVRLARGFLAFFARAAGRRLPQITPEFEAALRAYAWPGNVRELRNTMERAVILWPADRLPLEALPDRLASSAAASSPIVGGAVTLEELEREHIQHVLRRTATQEDAARILGIDVSTLWRKRKRYEG